MAKSWFRKLFPSLQSVAKSREVHFLKRFLKSDDFWSFEMQPVARGVAAGLAGAVIPGFQFFYAALLGIVLRGNLLIALMGTFITNPLTVVPFVYFIYWIGSLVIGNGHPHLEFQQFNWHFHSFQQFWSNVSVWALQFGKSFLVGVVIVSSLLGVIGYFGTVFIWKLFRLFSKKK